MKKYFYLAVLLLGSWSAHAQKDNHQQYILNQIDKKYQDYCQVARQIWTFAELGYQESKSSTLLKETLKKSGFEIQSNAADIPTAFVASYGSGKPIIGILAEYDALPGLSQDSVPVQKPLKEGDSGHGCGHNLFGTASVAAAIALKDWMIQTKQAGTIRLYGTPAEEGGGGKVFMARSGLFDDVDAILHWHPGTSNNASASTCLAVKSGIFRFYGKTAHAAAAPDRGRSALDGVEAMNYMVNLMREHVPEKSRIHYVITKGGLAANVVPDYAEVEYVVRHPDVEETEKIWDRVVEAAKGAAQGTGTRMEVEVQSGLFNLLPNETLAKVMDANLQKVGGVIYTPAEMEFATKLRESFEGKVAPLSEAASVQPFKMGYFPASTDVGDVSWLVPTAGLSTATWVPGTAAHTWQATAADGMSIGFKGMSNAAKIIALSGAQLFNNPAIIKQAKEELVKRRGAEFQYKPMIGDRKPPFDYRKAL